ncbi:unnamed protein product [Sphenostylis stenocarpa]|uniref:Uncharacterized protein n=1 Tax=Sphenostylis stenocarpa TaxID=92480 RepID=A0AA86T0D0_9FABA|nr:unnamed protein product [Sphenostylis stenocarpa]
MARINPLILITLLLLVCHSSLLDARKILKIDAPLVLSLKGTPPTIEATSYVKSGRGKVYHFANEEVVSNPSPGEGHKGKKNQTQYKPKENNLSCHTKVKPIFNALMKCENDAKLIIFVTVGKHYTKMHIYKSINENHISFIGDIDIERFANIVFTCPFNTDFVE